MKPDETIRRTRPMGVIDGARYFDNLDQAQSYLEKLHSDTEDNAQMEAA